MNNTTPFYNPVGGYGFQASPAGSIYGQVKVPGYTNPLSQEQIKKMRNNGGGFSLKVDQDQINRAICTHRDPATKQHTLIQNADGTVTCTICGATFTPCDNSSKEDVEAAVRLMIDILQSAKMMYLDISDNVCADYFQMIPFIEKAPQLYQIAVDNMRQYDQPAINGQYGSNAFGMLNMITNPMQQNMMGMPMQPGMMQQPMMGGMMPQQTPFMQQQAAMVNGGNPFMAPQAQAPQQATDQQPAQPTANGDTTVQQQFSL